jgi:pilus assembly protein CpaB
VLTAENMRELSWASDTLPKGAFESKDALLKPGESRTVAASIGENEPITAGKLYDPRESVLAGRIREGMTGVTIKVNDSSSVGGFAQPDDRVDVIMTQTDNGNFSGGKAYAVTLLRNVRVLAVDQQTQRKAQPQPPKTVTLEASPEAAKKLTLAQAIGQLSLALTRGGPGEDDGGIIDTSDLVHRAPVPALPKVESVDPLVTVTRGSERKDYQVPVETRTFSTRLEAPLVPSE